MAGDEAETTDSVTIGTFRLDYEYEYEYEYFEFQTSDVSRAHALHAGFM